MPASKFKTPSLPKAAGAVSLIVAVAAISGCNSSKTFAGLTPGETLTQGYVIDQQSIDLVPVGSSREQVLLALGTPSTTATFDNEAFYYISQTRKRCRQGCAVAPLQRIRVGHRAAIKHARQLLHALRYAEIANA